MEDTEKYTEEISGQTYKNFIAYKEHKVKILIYNNSDKKSKDLTIILDDSFNDTTNMTNITNITNTTNLSNYIDN
jgi:hypothetical protein